jgi:predicted MFS family arabinose efflux permease
MAWMVWVIASMFYAYQYIIRVMPNIMLDDICERFGIGAMAFGQFSGVYYIGYSLLHIPVGILFDRFGPRKILTSCILLTVVGVMPLLFADHFAYPIIGRFLVGVGSSAAILGVFKIIRITFSEARFARMLSLSVTIGLLGAIYGGGPVSYMREVLGYTAVLQSFIVGGLLLAFITYWIVPEGTNPVEVPVWTSIREVLSNKSVLTCCLSAGLMVGPLEGFADVWGSAFLKHACGIQGTLAATLPSMIFIGMCFGAPILSLIAERAKSYLATIIGAGCTMAVCFITLLFISQGASLISVNFILVGIASAYQILAIFKASTYVREEVAGLTTAVTNMIIMVFGYAFHTIIGYIVSAMGGPTAPHALVFGVSVIPIALVLGTSGFIALYKQESKEKVKI